MSSNVLTNYINKIGGFFVDSFDYKAVLFNPIMIPILCGIVMVLFLANKLPNPGMVGGILAGIVFITWLLSMIVSSKWKSVSNKQNHHDNGGDII